MFDPDVFAVKLVALVANLFHIGSVFFQCHAVVVIQAKCRAIEVKEDQPVYFGVCLVGVR